MPRRSSSWPIAGSLRTATSSARNRSTAAAGVPLGTKTALVVDTSKPGNPDLAAEHFIDFWMGQGAWARTPDARKPPIAASVVNIRGWAHCLMKEPTPLAAFRELRIPVLYMTGSDSPASSRGVARLLLRTLPQVQHVEFPGMGHMAPVTHPAQINDAIARFL